MQRPMLKYMLLLTDLRSMPLAMIVRSARSNGGEGADVCGGNARAMFTYR